MIRRAAEQGHANAHYILATIHDFESEYQFEMPRTVAQWEHLRLAVKNESVAATVQMALAYRDGRGVRKNLRLARKLLRTMTRRGFSAYGASHYEYARLLLEQREPGQKQRAEEAWSHLFLAAISRDIDTRKKARELIAAHIRNPHYGRSRKDALYYIQNVKREQLSDRSVFSRPHWQYFLDDYCRRSLMYNLQNASFEQFVSFLFDHPLIDQNDQRWQIRWEHIASINPDYHTLVQHYTRLFRDPEFLLKNYTSSEIDRGFWNAVFGPFDEKKRINVGRVIRHKDVSVQEAEMCLESMYDLFAKLFARSDIHETWQGAAHMWWDSSLCSFGPYVEPETDYDRKRLTYRRRDTLAVAQRVNDINLHVMERILKLDSIECKAAALHGLNHLNHPDKKQVILDFFAATPDLPDFDQWYQYGMAAIEGKCM